VTDYYANWKARLAGTAVKTYLQPQLEDAGYYRQPIVRKLPNGQTETLGWVPVALWVENAELFGLIGVGDDMRELRDDELAGEQLWSWICRNPISYEVYKAVAENGEPWPDAPEVQLAKTMGEEPVPAANREVTRSDNAPPEEEDNRPEHEKVAEKIDSAIAVSKAHAITDQKSAEIALGIVNRLAELRLSARRRGEELYKPHYNKYVMIRDQWKPPVERADAEEKRQTANINSWKRAEEKRLREEAAKAEAERKRLEEEALARSREQEEAAARAMDRAIANGGAPATMEMPFEVERPEPVAAAPAPVAPTTVALAPTYGKRKLRDTPKEPTFTIDDYDAVYAHFKNLESVKSCLAVLVKAAVKANITVPGVTVTKEEE
jgi:hypothetical protein